MTKQEAISIAKSILFRVRQAESERAIFQQCCDNRIQYQAGLNVSPVFWMTVTRALVHSMMIELAKVYDESRNVYGLKHFLIECQSCSDISDTFQIEALMSDYNKNESLHRNLRKQRNKIWAHSDADFFLEPSLVEMEYELSWQNIEQLIDLAQNICNSVLNAFGETGESVSYTNTDDVLLILETMTERAKKSITF